MRMFYGVKGGKVVAASNAAQSLVGFDRIIESDEQYNGPFELIKYDGEKLIFPTQEEINQFYKKMNEEHKKLVERLKRQASNRAGA